MRAMWKGAISFGLVTIPVKLYAATEEKDLHFKQLHKQCGTPIRYKKFCPTCGVDVDAEQIVKGYEIEKESYVTVEEEELESIPVAASRALEIVDFIHLSEIDPVFYDKTYYLEPGDGGSKPYALLRRAMEETGRIAVAKVVMRSKESLAAIRVFREGVLALETMHFPDEVRSPAGLKGIVEPELRPQEVEMAKGLVLSLSSPFEPAKYQNEYRDAVLQLISAKAHGALPVLEAAPKPGRVVDLMEALRASIQVAEAERGVAAAAVGSEVVPVAAAAAALGAEPPAAAPTVAPAAAVPAVAPAVVPPSVAPTVGPEAAPPGVAPAAVAPAVAPAATAPAAAPAAAAPPTPQVDRPVVPPPPSAPTAIPRIIIPGLSPTEAPAPSIAAAAPNVAAPPAFASDSPVHAPNLFGAPAVAPPATQPTAAAAAAGTPPERRPTAPYTDSPEGTPRGALREGRRPLPPSRRLPPGAIPGGQSVWQYRPQL